MSIEINGSTGRPPIDTGEASQSADKAGRPTDNPSATSTAAGAADTFSLTNKASQMKQLEAQIANLPVVDTQRVHDVQHAIATNTLQVKPAEVAEKLLAFEAGLSEPGNS